MSVINVSSLSKFIGDRPLFEDVAFKLDRGDRMTLSGRNGSGKTTLLRLIAGEVGKDAGTVALGKGVRTMLHDQRPPRGQETVRAYVTSGLAWIVTIEDELARLEQRMATEGDDATLEAYSRAQARFELAGGYLWRDEAMQTVRHLGFGEEHLDRPLQSFSGGELTRISLARALAAKPDLLLLDEPTNHLDIESLEWLEGYLVNLDAAVILVAHDRWFLESVGTSVLELEAGRARYFKGPWHAWRAEQAARELALERDTAKREAKVAQLERFVERFRYKKTKARQAQSKIKAIDRIKAGAQTGDPRDNRSLAFSFGNAERSGRVVLELEGGRIEAGDKALLDDAEIWLERGEHVTLVGANGSGKTTLVEMLSGNRELPAGKLRRGHNVTLGYLSQHTELGGHTGKTMLAYAQEHTGLSEAKVRALLGGFLFSGDEVKKNVTDLSGGESRRLSLALLTHSDANFLILDEPTNHLDLDGREALEDALTAFDGTLLLISHDRALLEAVGSRTVVIEGHTLRSHPGGWAEYRADREAEAEAASSKPAKQERRKGAPGPSKNRQAKVAKLERQVADAEAALGKLEDELADASHWSDPQRAAKATERHEQARVRLAELMQRWEAEAEEA